KHCKRHRFVLSTCPPTCVRGGYVNKDATMARFVTSPRAAPVQLAAAEAFAMRRWHRLVVYTSVVSIAAVVFGMTAAFARGAGRGVGGRDSGWPSRGRTATPVGSTEPRRPSSNSDLREEPWKSGTKSVGSTANRPQCVLK